MEKNMYIFILGRNPVLSASEIRSVFEKNNWEYEVILESREVLIVASEKVDVEMLEKKLGGTVKIGKVEKISTMAGLEQDLDIDFFLEKILSSWDGKIQFGISVYDGGEKNVTEELAGMIIPFSKGIKALLEQKQKSVRFAFSRERTLSSVVVSKNKLIQKGAELLLIPSVDKVYIGKTLFVQEFEQFSRRDYGRPARDMKSGIMPPKLARMMINIAKVDEGGVLLDPFCGSGTMIQEALQLGFTTIIGSDISEKAIADTQENLNWLEKIVGLDISGVELKKEDVGDIGRNVLPESISAIVTEPYLGPTLHNQMYPEKLQHILKELSSLYLKAFSEFQKVLTPGGVVVMILPAFSQRNGLVFMPIIEEVERLGFKSEQIGDTKRGTVVYGNKYDFVLREIIKMRKV